MGMAWPSTLPMPLLDGYSTAPGVEVARTDMEAGEARVRRRSVSVPDTIKLAWILDAAQMKIFRAYWDVELAAGAAWCDMNVDVGDGIEQKSVRIIGQYQAAMLSPSHWKVSCEAEVRKLRLSVFDYLNLMGLPSLDLDFAGTQSLSPVITSARQPSPAVSFARASEATYIGADGLLKIAADNEPRFDFDPVTLVCKGLLIEAARTNMLLYSEQFDNATWGKTRASVAPNATAAPDGGVTAESLIEDASAATTHYVTQSASFVSGNTYTQQVFVKAGTRSHIELRFTGAGGFSSNQAILFNLSAGTFAVSAGGPVGAMRQVGDGWWRCSCAAVADATGAASVQYRLSDGVSTSYTGDGVSGLYIWGGQLEAGAFPTSYIPTTSAAATRASDVAQMTGVSLSSWYRPDEGCFVSAFDVFGVYSGFDSTVFAVNNTTQNEQIDFRAFTSGVGGRVRVGGTNQSSSSQSPVPEIGSTYRVAVAYKTNDQAYATNGAATATDVLCAIPAAVSKFEIGSRVASGYLNGHISRLTYFPQRLPNATLQALTA